MALRIVSDEGKPSAAIKLRWTPRCRTDLEQIDQPTPRDVDGGAGFAGLSRLVDEVS
jgi:anti-sigma regulatory factor (Ser/Thr protein kinase)